MLHPRFDEAFRQLVQRWEEHEQAYRAGDITRLARAKAELDKARIRAAQARRFAA